MTRQHNIEGIGLDSFEPHGLPAERDDLNVVALQHLEHEC